MLFRFVINPTRIELKKGEDNMKKEELVSFLEAKSSDVSTAQMMAPLKSKRKDQEFPSFDYYYVAELDNKLIGSK